MNEKIDTSWADFWKNRVLMQYECLAANCSTPQLRVLSVLRVLPVLCITCVMCIMCVTCITCDHMYYTYHPCHLYALKPSTHWQQSWIQQCHNCVALVPYTLATKSTVSATKSTATRCWSHVVADLLPKPATKLNVLATMLNVYGNSRLCWRFVEQLTFNNVDHVDFSFVASVYQA